MRKRAVISLIFLSCLLQGGSLFAQKKLDSLVNSATSIIFENPDRAISLGLQVYGEATQAKTKIGALMLISNSYLSKRENSKSLEYALMARDHLNEISSIKTRINVLNAIGMQHQQLRIYDKAIDYLDDALLLSKQIKNPDSLPSLLGYNYTIRGFIYREQMSCDIALNYFDKAIVQFKKISGNNAMTANLSTLNYNKGNCFLQIGQIDAARESFNRAIAYAQEVGANSLYAFAKKGLSEVYTVEGNYGKAIQELKEAEKTSEKVGDLILNQGIYKNLSDNYLALNNRELYKTYSEKYSVVQQQIYEREQKTIDNSIKALIEDNRLSANSIMSKFNRIIAALIILVVLVLGLSIYFLLKNRRKFLVAKEKLQHLQV